tara:strand:- start:1157 stop:1567 length:411 start_codon:yes stop_codon:yes gene_type:complete
MAKKSVKKPMKRVSSKKPSEKLEDKILQNLVELQKVHVNLAEKFENLSEQISGLLALFETTARTFAKQVPEAVVEKDKEFLEKIDRLLDQNKTIAKGLTMMESKMREKIYGPVVRRPTRPITRQEEFIKSRKPAGF